MPSAIWAPSKAAHKAERAELAAAKAKEGRKPPPQYLWKAYLALSAFGQRAVFLDPSDADLRTALSQIEKTLTSKIRIDEEDSRLYIEAENEVNGGATIEATLYVLCDREQHETNVWHPWVVLNLPQHGEHDFKLSLEKVSGARGVRATLLPPTKPLTETDDLITLAPMEKVYQEDVKRVLDTVVEGLRVNPNKMIMRVHFGTIGLLEWTKNKASYTPPELKRLFSRAGPRGTAIFETLIQNDGVVDELRRRLADLPATIPMDINITSFYEIEPTYSVVLITKDLHVESEIYQTIGQGIVKWGVEETIAHSFTPVRAMHREKKSRTVEVMSSCPQSQFDWVLEVQNTVETAIPFDNEALRQNTEFTGEYWPSGFPAFKIYSHFTKASKLEDIIGKKTWRHPVNTMYTVEISTYHRWVDGAMGPSIGFGLNLYCSEWDGLTRPANIVSGPRPWRNFADVFLHEDLRKDDLVKGQECSGEEDGVADFLYWVDRVQRIVENVCNGKGDEGTGEEEEEEEEEDTDDVPEGVLIHI